MIKKKTPPSQNEDWKHFCPKGTTRYGEEPSTKGKAAQETLNSGRPIYYAEPDTPDGLAIREWPNGKKELIKRIRRGEIQVIKTL